MNKKKLFVIDSYSLIFKSYYAMSRNPLRNKDGQNISAVFGYFNTLLSIFKEYNPDYLIIAGDSKGETFRKQLYSPYKINRIEAPEDLKTQFSLIELGLKKSNLFYLTLEGYEADDIIASVANKYSVKNNLDIYIYSMDKDFMQLIKENVFLMRSSRTGEKIIFDMEKVLKEKGVETWQFIDYQAILGDSVDNVPGVKGIGEKGASKLLKKYKTLEGIYQNIEKISGKQKIALENNRDNAFMSKVLVTLKRDINLNLNLNDLEFNRIDFNSMRLFFASQGFKSLTKIVLKEYQKENQAELFDNLANEELKRKKSNFSDFKIIKNEEDICKLKSKLEDELFVFQDKDEFFLLTENNIFLIDCDLKLLKSILQNKKIISMNFKSDFKFLLKKKIEIKPYFSLDIAGYLLKSEAEIRDLEYLFFNYLGLNIKELEKIEILSSLFLLYKTIKTKIELKDLKYLFYKIEMPLSKILCQMELEGILFDKNQLRKIEDELKKKIKNIENEIYKEAFLGIKLAIKNLKLSALQLENSDNFEIVMEKIKINADKLQDEVFDQEKIKPIFFEFKETLLNLYKNKNDKFLIDTLKIKIDLLSQKSLEKFNILSSKQLQVILFEKRKLKHGKKIKTGYSTDIHVLKDLAKKDKLSALILKYRTYKKLNSSYVLTLINFIGKDQKIHTTFEQTKTATGRLASENPNIQNIPSNTTEFKIRNCFVSKKNYSFVSADYSQIELVIMAYYANDLHMLNAIKTGSDIHKQTATKIFKISENEVDNDKRNIAKAVNFGIIYGISAYGLALNLNISHSIAKEFLQNYFKEFKSVKIFLEETLEKSEKQGEVRTIFNRIREIKQSFNENQRKLNQRLSVNSIIQGSSADIIKKAMLDIQKELNKKIKIKIFIKDKNLKSSLKIINIRSKNKRVFVKFLEKSNFKGFVIRKRKLRCKMILQIHDELIFECHDEDINDLKILLKNKMVNLPFKIELERLIKINIKIGKTWGNLN